MPQITPQFRAAMDWVHSWLGVVLGAILFAVFWTGSLTVFSKEIDRWMIPELRLEERRQAISYDALIAKMPAAARTSDYINFVAPAERTPQLGFFYRAADGTFHDFTYDPATGQELSLTASHAASGFFYPFHHTFTIYWMDLGMWIVGFAALAMLILLVSGLFVHRKIFAEFFVFRPRRKAPRATLDLHNSTALFGLPFYFLITFSGLLTFAFYYLPWAVAEPYEGNTDALFAEAAGEYDPGERTGRPASLASVDAMKARAERLWSAQEGTRVEANIVRILNHGDETAVVYLRNTFPDDRVVLSEYVAVFDGATGKLIQNFSRPPISEVSGWIQGAHFMHVDHWPMRWLYFLAGLGGCVTIATGMLFWLRSREGRINRHSAGFRLVETLTIGGVTGIIAATGAFLAANRLLPSDATLGGIGRADLEVRVFLYVWLAAFIHAAVFRERAWAQQCLAIAALAVGAAALNWATTRSIPLPALASVDVAVAAIDVLLLLTAALATVATVKLRRLTPRSLAAIRAPAE